MRRFGAAVVSLAVFLLAWKVVVLLGDYPDYILPAPEAVVERGIRAVQSGVLWEHTAATLIEVVLGFGLGASVAIVVGTALGKSILIERDRARPAALPVVDRHPPARRPGDCLAQAGIARGELVVSE